MRPSLVASDLDGTLINSAERITPRLRSVLARIDAAGIPLVLATGRPIRWVAPVVEQLPLRPLCICSNGASIYDSEVNETLATYALQPDIMNHVAKTARAVIPDLALAAEWATHHFAVSATYMHSWHSTEHDVLGEEEILAQPALKLLLRSRVMDSKEMYDAVREYITEDEAYITFSLNDGLLEVAAPGVNKAHGLALIARSLGVAAENVVCFGDMPNDIEMLTWAGYGVATANARPEAKAAADFVTKSNDDDGVAHVLEQWF